MRKYFDVVFLTTSIPAAGAYVYVLDSAGNRVPLFSDNGVTSTPNPVTSDRTGFFSFYVADGTYTLQYVLNSVTLRTLTAVQIYDESSASGIPNEIALGTAPDAGALIGTETIPMSRGAGLLQSTLNTISNFVYSKATILASSFGIVADGFTDNTTALQNLLNYLSTHGGRVVFGPGIVVVNGIVSKDALQNCVFEGAGGGFLGGNVGTILKFSSSSSNPFVLTNSVSLTFRNITFAYGSTTFSGSLCDFSCTTPANVTNLNFYDCNFTQAASSDTFTAFSLVRLKNVTRVSFMNCVFQKATNAVSGNEGAFSALTNNSGQVSFFGCEFTKCINSIAYPGSIWHLRDCNFEPASNLTPSTIYNAANTFTNNLVIDGCSFVDSAAAGTWINLLSVETIAIENCIFGGNLANNGISLSGGNAININGNYFVSLINGLTFNNGFTHDSGTVTGNHFSTNTNAIVGSGNTTNMLINYNKLT